MRTSNRAWSISGALVACALAAALTGGDTGCSFATNTTAIQCSNEAECVALGPEFAGTTCDVATRTCVKVPEDSDLCKTNKECIDKAGGQPAICRKSNRKCVPLLTRECPKVFAQPGQLLDDNTIVIGAETPAQTVELGDVMEETVRFFQNEFSTKVKGLPGLNGGPVRPIVILSCAEFAGGFSGSGYDDVIRSAEHLVKEVGVPLIIGPVDPAHTAVIASQVTLPGRTLVIQPTGVATFINEFPSPTAPTPIIWSVSPNDHQFLNAAAELLTKQLEPALKASVATARPIKVVTITEGTSYGRGTADAIEKIITFNGGKTAAQNSADGNYLRLDIGDSIDKINNPAPEEQVAKVIGEVIGFMPDVVLDVFTPSAIPTTFYPLAYGWPAGLPFPYHVDIVNTFGSFAPLFDVLTAVPPLQGKVFSLAAHRDAARIARADQFVIKFNSFSPQFRTSKTQQSPLVQQWYDACYLGAYALAANGDKPMTGENLGKTLPLLGPPGAVINVGTEDSVKALGLLGGGMPVDLEGLVGNMNLDPKNATVTYDTDITCPARDPQSGKIVNFKPSGFFLTAATHQGSGTLACPTAP